MAYIKLLDSKLQKLKNIYARNIWYVFVTLISPSEKRKKMYLLYKMYFFFEIHYFSVILSVHIV